MGAGELDPPGNSQVWRHTVYAGIFDIGKVREVLQNILRAPDTEHDLDGRIGGKSALLSFAVDDTGHLLKDSATLSSCAWAVSRTLMPGPGSDAWLDGFGRIRSGCWPIFSRSGMGGSASTLIPWEDRVVGEGSASSPGQRRE